MTAPVTRTAEEVGAHVEGVLSRSVVMLVAKAATWVLAFVMTVLLPRRLGAAGFGRLYFAISFTAMASILVEFGLNALVTREVAKRPSETTRYLVNGALLKFVLWLVALGVITVVVFVARYPASTRTAVFILAVGMLLTSMSSLIWAALQGMERARWVAASAVVEKAVYVALGASAVLLGFGVVVVAATILVAAAAKLLLDLWWFHRLSASVDLRGGWRGLEVRRLFRRGIPFFSMLFFGAIYFRVDVVIMSLFRGDTAVGWYGAAYRLFETTNLVPEAIIFAFFPMFCRFAKHDPDSLPLAAQKALNLLLLVGVPLATGVAVLAGRVIELLYGAQYENSVLVLRILAPAIALMYVNGAFTQLLIAIDRQRRLVVTAAAAAILNVGLNLVLIPRFGPYGAAFTTAATEAVVIGLNFSFLPREFTRRLSFAAPLKVVAASCAMALAILALGEAPLPLLVAAGVAVYAATLVVLRAVPAEDWAMMRRSLLNVRAA